MRIGIRRRDKLGAGPVGQRAHGRRRCRGPAAAGAEIKAFLTEAFETCEAHGVNRRLGDQQSKAVKRPEPEQDLGAAAGKTAPGRSAFLPAGHDPFLVDMSRPHAAMWPLSQDILIRRHTENLLGDPPDVSEIAPRRRTTPGRPTRPPSLRQRHRVFPRS